MTRSSDEAERPSSVIGDVVYETEVGDRRASEAIVDIVAAVLDRKPTDLAPLYETLDPEALDALCASADENTRPVVRFDYEGLIVTVTAPNDISVVEP